jgi:hypothetical protein
MYKLSPMAFNQTVPSCVIRLSDGTAIPFAIANIDYQEYLKWLEAGNTPLPAEEQGA